MPVGEKAGYMVQASGDADLRGTDGRIGTDMLAESWAMDGAFFGIISVQ